MSLTPYLHTSYKYVQPTINLAGFNLDRHTPEMRSAHILEAIARLEQKENEFYQQYGCKNEEEFFNTIRDFFSVSPKDKEVFARFNNENLRQYLFNMMGKNGALQSSDVQIVFKKCPKINIGEILQKAGSGANFTFSYNGSGDLTLTGEWETGKIRSILNRINESKTEWKKIKNKQQLVDFLLKEDDIIIYQFNQDIGHDQTLNLRLNHPLSRNSNEIKDLDKQAIAELYTKLNNLFKELIKGASPILAASAREVWQEKFKNAEGGLKRAALTFFSGGENWLKDAMGAFGEFQLAVFLKYISKKADKNNLQPLIKLVGNEYSIYAQQKHTDVQALQSLNGVDVRYGFQSKNFRGPLDTKGNVRKIEIKLHPTEIRGLAGTEQATFIINHYFNQSFPQAEYLTFLTNFFYNNITEFLNLDYFEDDYVIPDKVTFYFISGRLIPGSVILKQAFSESAESIKISTPHITGNESGKDDEKYRTEKVEDPHHKGQKEALFLQYWRTPKDGKEGTYEPTEKNNLVYWNRAISIRTTFTYGSLWNSNRYNLFE